MGCSKNYFSPELCIGVGWSRERDRVIQTDTQIRIHTHTNRKSWAEIVVEMQTIA